MINKIIVLLLIIIVSFTGLISYKLFENKKINNKTHIKVFFGNNFQDEKSYVQSFNNWYKGMNDNKFTLEELYNDGWKLVNTVKTNGSAVEWQISFFMEISDTDFNLVKSKYETKEIKLNAVVPTKEGL
jgi:hypothetical protein